MAVTIAALSTLAKTALDKYVKENPFGQNMQNRPLLTAFTQKRKSFPGGKGNLSRPVQFDYASDDSSFATGDLKADPDKVLTFAHTDNGARAEAPYDIVHFGIKMSFTELLEHGITVTDEGTKEKVGAGDVKLIENYLDWKLEDFNESRERLMNTIVWGDGTGTTADYPAGLRSIITDSPATDTNILGINAVTEDAWRNDAYVGANAIEYSRENQTLTKTLRSRIRQLRRYRGNPDMIVAGSTFLEKLEEEVFEKGAYTQTGFVNNGKLDVGMADIAMKGVGAFQYEPTLDDLGFEDRCYFIDTSKLNIWAVEGEWMKTLHPQRPYDQLVVFKSVTATFCLHTTLRNAHGVYQVKTT